LKGEVEMIPAKNVEKVHNVKDMLELAAKMEDESAQEYNVWANECAQNADAATKKIFEALVDDEERHFDQYDKEIDNLNKFGDNYLALQSIEHSKNVAAGKSEE
jgi:bacterioferritin